MEGALGNSCWYVVPKGLFHSVSKEVICLKNQNSCKGSKAAIIMFLFYKVVQQNMRVTKRIFSPLLTKSLYEFGCFEEILQKANFAPLLFYWVTLIHFYVAIISNLAKMALSQLFTARNLIFLFQTSTVPFSKYNYSCTYNEKETSLGKKTQNRCNFESSHKKILWFAST